MNRAQTEGTSLNIRSNETAMKNVVRYRATASLCRQHAAYNPNDSWKLLAQAEHWEHLATVEMSSRFEECNAAAPTGASEAGATASPHDIGWKTTAAA
jgi:hypothetical protein